MVFARPVNNRLRQLDKKILVIIVIHIFNEISIIQLHFNTVIKYCALPTLYFTKTSYVMILLSNKYIKFFSKFFSYQYIIIQLKFIIYYEYVNIINIILSLKLY
jgi:hypothetical protein